MSIEWDSLILGRNDLKTVGPATENARPANSVRTRGTNNRGFHLTAWSVLFGRKCFQKFVGYYDCVLFIHAVHADHLSDAQPLDHCDILDGWQSVSRVVR